MRNLYLHLTLYHAAVDHLWQMDAMIAKLSTAAAPPLSHTRSNHEKQSCSASPLPCLQGWQSVHQGAQGDKESHFKKDF